MELVFQKQNNNNKRKQGQKHFRKYRLIMLPANTDFYIFIKDNT